MNRRTAAAFALVLTAMASEGLRAQQPVTPDENARRLAEEQRTKRIASLNDKTPLQVQVTVSRYNGDKKISSMPYVLTVNAAGSEFELGRAENARLRMGSQVPVPTFSFTPARPPDGSPQPEPLRSFSYQDIGTNIDCRARSMGDGRFELGISVEEKSVFTDVKDGSSAQQAPVIRSFQTSQNLILRDGQSRQFTAATDRVSGEVVRIDVTLAVVK